MSDTQTTRVWVVMGGTGEYSDRREWSVRAYLDKPQAEAEVERLSGEARALFSNVGYGYEDHQREAAGAHGARVGDPAFDMDYTGTSYFYYEVPLVTDVSK